MTAAGIILAVVPLFVEPRTRRLERRAYESLPLCPRGC